MTPIPDPRSRSPLSRSAVKTWLSARQPEPPADLAAKLAQCVDDAPAATFEGASLAEVVGALGTWLLASVVECRQTAHASAPDAGRPAIDTSDAPPAGSDREPGAAALDLLAADAFVTYAFEAASEEGTDVTGLANDLLARVRA